MKLSRTPQAQRSAMDSLSSQVAALLLGVSSSWTPKACQKMACSAILGGFGLFFYILWGSRLPPQPLAECKNQLLPGFRRWLRPSPKGPRWWHNFQGLWTFHGWNNVQFQPKPKSFFTNKDLQNPYVTRLYLRSTSHGPLVWTPKSATYHVPVRAHTFNPTQTRKKQMRAATRGPYFESLSHPVVGSSIQLPRASGVYHPSSRGFKCR